MLWLEPGRALLLCSIQLIAGRRCAKTRHQTIPPFDSYNGERQIRRFFLGEPLSHTLSVSPAHQNKSVRQRARSARVWSLPQSERLPPTNVESGRHGVRELGVPIYGAHEVSGLVQDDAGVEIVLSNFRRACSRLPFGAASCSGPRVAKHYGADFARTR